VEGLKFFSNRRRRRLNFFPPKDSPCLESQPLVEANEHVFLLRCPALERSVMVKIG
jgi:hypothetical protein